MLAVNKYTSTYIDECRSMVHRQLSTYDDLVDAARNGGGPDDAAIDGAIEAFEPVFYNNLVLVLDGYFCHRTRAIEGKDGNPINEVRVLCNSILHNGGRMSADKTIKLQPAESILKYEVGDDVQLSGAQFTALSEAYLAEIEKRYLALRK